MDANTTDVALQKIRWQWCSLQELTSNELYAVLAAREAVFVVEQNCAYQELDGLDFAAEHLIAWSGSDVVAYLRLLQPHTRFAEASIGRIFTSRTYRGAGLGRVLVATALERLDEVHRAPQVRISAQAHLAKFYGEFGFVGASEPYLEDGIPHIEMLRLARTS